MSRDTNQQIAAGFSQGLQNFVGGYTQRKDAEIAKARQQQQLQQALEDPNTSELQKALALSEVSPQIANQYLKSEQEKTQLQDFLAGSQQAPPSRIPQGQERYAAMQSQVPTSQTPGIGINAPPQPGMQPQAQQPMQQQPQEGAIFSNLSDSKLKEGIARFGKNPAIGGAIKEELADRRAEKNRNAKEQVALRKENQAFRGKILDGVKAAKKMDFQLNEMEQLNDEGVEVSPLGYTALKIAGVPLSGFFDAPNAEALDKLANDTTTGAIRDYGSRLYASEFNTFLKRIPQLWMSDEGRRRVIKTMRMYNDLEKSEQDSYFTLYNAQKEQGEKNPLVRQEDVLAFSEEKENQIIQALNTELAQERQTRDLGEIPNDKVLMRFPDGQILPVPKKDASEALQMGGVLQ